MAGSTLNLQVKCPRCFASLMCKDIQVDGRPSIDVRAKVGVLEGHIYLSQVYGSYEKVFGGVPDVRGSIETFSCPHCDAPLPVQQTCPCGAPMVGIDLVIGGIIRFCTRNGCEEHHLEFDNPDDAFVLYESQTEANARGGA